MLYLHRMVQYKNIWLHGVVHTRVSVLSHCSWLLEGLSIAYDVWGCRDGCHNSVLDIRLDGLCNAWVLIIHHINLQWLQMLIWVEKYMHMKQYKWKYVSSIVKKFQELLKELSCVSEAANPRIQSLSTSTPPYLSFLCRKEVPVSHIELTFSLSFIFHKSLSVTGFQNFYHQFLLVMTNSYGYTPPNSTSGWRMVS